MPRVSAGGALAMWQFIGIIFLCTRLSSKCVCLCANRAQRLRGPSGGPPLPVRLGGPWCWWSPWASSDSTPLWHDLPLPFTPTTPKVGPGHRGDGHGQPLGDDSLGLHDA